MIFKKKYIGLVIIPQLVFIQYISNYPEIIEKYYSLGIYQFISNILRSALSIFPFSIGDVLYIIMFAYFIRLLIKEISKKKFNLQNGIKSIFFYVSILHFLFYFQWGLNYHRTSLQEKLTIDLTYTVKDLKEVSKKLIIKSNKLHRQITIADSSSTEIPYNIAKINEIASNGYNNLSLLKEYYPNVNTNNLIVKKSLISLPLTYLGFSGYINPFTNESQINSLIPKNSIPHTASHEIAHQLGFSQEQECNFIAFVNLTNSQDLYFKYNGYLFALRQCLNELYKYDKPSYNSLLKLLNTGILKDFKNNSEFWKNYSNPIESITKSGYDKFLKFNNISQGIKSYNQSVSLIINYQKKKT